MQSSRSSSRSTSHSSSRSHNNSPELAENDVHGKGLSRSKSLSRGQRSKSIGIRLHGLGNPIVPSVEY